MAKERNEQARGIYSEYEKIIVRRSTEELVRAAKAGRPYYSCEQIEDSYGRMVVGVGTCLEGRALEYILEKKEGGLLYVSARAFRDNPQFRIAMRRAMRRDRLQEGAEVVNKPEKKAEKVETKEMIKPQQEDYKRVMDAFKAFCPGAVGLVARLNPGREHLAHGLHVADYASRLIDQYNADRNWGIAPTPYPYSEKMRNEVFLAGILHDVGCWKGEREGHEARGVQLIEKMEGNSAQLRNLSGLIAQHHELNAVLSRSKWDMQKIVPLVLAEAVIESEKPVVETIRDMVLSTQSAIGVSGPFLAGVCNLERIIPAGAIVRVWKQVADSQSQRNEIAALAVRLSCTDEEGFGPYLLCFTQIVAENRLVPFLQNKQTPQEIAAHIIALGHPIFARLEWRVVKLLTPGAYASEFQRYESVVPIYKQTLAHNIALWKSNFPPKD